MMQEDLKTTSAKKRDSAKHNSYFSCVVVAACLRFVKP